MPSPPPLVWFLLLDSADGLPFQGTTVSSVSLPPGSVVDQFRDAVKAKYDQPAYLKNIPSGTLRVYKNKAVLNKEAPLEEDSFVNGFGKSKKDALVVIVPSSSSSSRCISDNPHPKRKQRWIQLNDILEANAKRSKTNYGAAYTNVTWTQVKSVLNPEEYVQPRREIDETQLDHLVKYLACTAKCFGGVCTGVEAKHLYFIAPIVICVCAHFNGDVEIVVEEDLVGAFLKAHSRFEFMLRRGNKAVCILEAKTGDLEQSMAQELVGCEVAADLFGLDVVYGIVTNYHWWSFFRSLNDKIEREECFLRLTCDDGPQRESLKEIAEKIYSMLSD